MGGARDARSEGVIALDHLIVPAGDRNTSAEKLARILGVRWSPTGVGPFSPVFVSDGLTLDFDQAEGVLPVQHYCFRVDEATFDAIVARLREAHIAFRSTPHGPIDGAINTRHGGRIVYWSEPDGHVWEALTVSYARDPLAGGSQRLSRTIRARPRNALPSPQETP